jgi:sterol desaturase/sphingolipid hydroxylase (fatty acid hydroxylase superfamily)
MNTVYQSLCTVLDCVGIERLLGATLFFLAETPLRQWQWWHAVVWIGFIVGALELLSWLVLVYGRLRFDQSQLIAHRGKHLDELSTTDLCFVTFNKLTTTLFTLHLLWYAWYNDDTVTWQTPSTPLEWLGSIALLPALFLVYDFGYTLFHKALHLRGVYRYIHKHHHRQKAPSRGNVDAVNVHPFEFVSGEYNHLLALFVVGRLVAPVHAVLAVAFVLCGGVLASLNHTRFDVRLPLIDGIYQVKYHDIHHWYPNANCKCSVNLSSPTKNLTSNIVGQYTMIWDHIFGWFKPYPLDDRGVRRPKKNQTMKKD